MTTKRKRTESLTDYKVRICENKEPLDLTWEEIAYLINQETGENFTESTYRKWYKNFSDGIDYAIENRAEETVIQKKRVQEHNLKKERVRLSTEKLEMNRLLREETRQEMIADKIAEAVLQLKPIQVEKISPRSISHETVITVDLADMHFGREGVIKGFHGEVLAEYSDDIFYTRMGILLQQINKIVEKENASKIHIFNLGDSIDGLLRLTQLNFLSMGVIDSVIQLAEFLSNWLVEVAKIGLEVEYHSVLGNHAEMRIAGIKSGELPNENLEKIITWFIKERTKNISNLIVHDPEFIKVVNILGTHVCLTHGQNEKNLENSIKNYSMIYGEQIHILKTGHLHHTHSKTIGMSNGKNIEYIQSPSICGIDEYSMKLQKTASAGTLITSFAQDRGKITYEVTL